jgi:cytochrome c oxidase subunit 2
MMSSGIVSMLRAGSPDPGGRSFWMPPQVSTVAPNVDFLFYFILGISVFFFVLIVALMLYFIIRYRRRPGHEVEASRSHNLALEITWTAIPVLLVIVIFVIGFRGFLDMVTPPANAYEILVQGQKWNWSFTYPNGYVDPDLHVPVDRPVRLVMQSSDVIHSLFIPAFRVKSDVVPGRYAKAWFEATEPGEYDLFCAEYCGTGHSSMIAKVVVHRPGEFESWLAKASDFLATMTPVEGGRKLFQERGCTQCHSVDGSPRVGPSLKGAFGRTETMASGERLVIDENYIRESVLEPAARVVKGFEPVMPTYQGRLRDKEIDALIAYIKSLSDAEGD